MSTALYLGIGGVLLLIIIIVAYTMMSGKKEEKETTEESSSTQQPSTQQPSTQQQAETLNVPSAPESKPAWFAPAANPQPAYHNYDIKPKNSGKCVDIARASKGNEADIHLWDCHGDWNQKFQFKPELNGKFYNDGSNKCWNVWGGAAEGNTVKQYDCTDGSNTQFEYDQKQRFRLKAHNDLCIGVENYNNGTILKLQKCSDDEKQKWVSPQA